MYSLKPWRVYALDTMLEDSDARPRIERMLAASGKTVDDLRVYSLDTAYDAAREIQEWNPEDAAPGTPWQHQRALIFTRIAMEGTPEEEPLIQNAPEGVSCEVLKALLGYIERVRDTHDENQDREKNQVCWNTQDLGVMQGCPHGCFYCGAGKSGKFVAAAMNVREYMDDFVGPLIESHPGQKCFRLIGWGSDIATFEPEYGAFETFLEKLSEDPDTYGYFHTAGDNVDWVKDVAHRDRLIGVWSLTGDTVARTIEPAAPSGLERVLAAAKCQEWGLPIRFKFKPMIPVKGWREDYSKLIRDIFEHTRPESIGFAVVMWMDLDELDRRVGLEHIDPDLVARAREGRDELAQPRAARTGPFPHDVRAEIYRFLIQEIRKYDAKVPLYVSTESNEMWEELSGELGQNPRTFICGCNPIEAPGPRMLVNEHIRCSTFTGSQV